jgi:5-methyltetrahydrofolate--homocysteine methyltransferase
MEGEISRKTVARYLGYRGKTLDEPTAALVEEAIRELSAVTPRHVLRRLPLSITKSNVRIGSLAVESKSLAEHLKGCREAILLAATLGVKADQVIHRAAVVHMSRAVVLQACAAARLEAYLNDAGEALTGELQKEGLYLTPRFSPGYGDLTLGCQEEILALLEAGKRIGLGLTAEHMLAPTKSVTAILGLSPEKQSACCQVCQKCQNTACPFREE